MGCFAIIKNHGYDELELLDDDDELDDEELSLELLESLESDEDNDELDDEPELELLLLLLLLLLELFLFLLFPSLPSPLNLSTFLFNSRSRFCLSSNINSSSFPNFANS